MSSVIDWLSSIGEKITNLPTLIYSNFRDPLANILSFILQLPDKLFNAFKDTLGKILTYLQFLPDNIYEFFKDTFNNILNLVKIMPKTIFNFFSELLNNIVDIITNLPTTVYNAFKTGLEAIKAAVGAVAGAIYNFFKPAIDTFLEFVRKVLDFWGGLLNLIINAIKRVFIPEDTVINNTVKKLSDRFNEFLVAYDIKGLVKSGQMFGDIEVTINKQNLTIIDASFVEDAVLHFKPLIRGFMILLLVFFNINQFLAFIGQPAISVVGGLKELNTSDDKENRGKGKK